MPVAGPRKNALEKRPQAADCVTLAKKDFLDVLHRAHIPEETIKEVDAQLHDPVRHGLDRDQLVSRMGGSP
jgi:hypothetical protein